MKWKIKWFIGHYFKHKKCPYCGSHNWTSYLIIDDIPNYMEIREHWIECKKCGARTKSYHSKGPAMRAWDRGEVYNNGVE